MSVVLEPLDPENLGRVLVAFKPENAIIVNEAATTPARLGVRLMPPA